MNPLIRPRWLLHTEGAVLFVATIVSYWQLSGAWWLFALLFFAPDIGILSYLANVRVGATIYNLVHTEILPAGLLGIGFFATQHAIVLVSLIWLSHIGFDRLNGFGLKYPTKFGDTHLQHV